MDSLFLIWQNIASFCSILCWILPLCFFFGLENLHLKLLLMFQYNQNVICVYHLFLHCTLRFGNAVHAVKIFVCVQIFELWFCPIGEAPDAAHTWGGHSAFRPTKAPTVPTPGPLRLGILGLCMSKKCLLWLSIKHLRSIGQYLVHKKRHLLLFEDAALEAQPRHEVAVGVGRNLSLSCDTVGPSARFCGVHRC